jgi:hypothetical protein
VTRYDLIVCGDKSYHKYDYAKRLNALKENFENPREKLKVPKDINEPFGFRVKPFYPVSEESYIRLKKMVDDKEVGSCFAHTALQWFVLARDLLISPRNGLHCTRVGTFFFFGVFHSYDLATSTLSLA